MNFIEGKNFAEILKENTDRELDEELSIQEEDKLEMKTLGLINDDDNSVGRVHIGLLSALELAPGAHVEVKETDQISGKWMKASDLKKPEYFDRLETWSQFVVNILA